MTIFIGADHAGFELKGKLIEFLKDLGYEVEDKGAFEYNKDDDYPDFIAPVAEEVSKDPENSRGIVLGGSGQGEAIVCNRFPGIRAVVYYGESSVAEAMEGERNKPFNIIKLSREHNDANILSLGARFLKDEEAKEAVKLWLETSFPGEERHKRRVSKIDQLGANI